MYVIIATYDFGSKDMSLKINRLETLDELFTNIILSFYKTFLFVEEDISVTFPERF